MIFSYRNALFTYLLTTIPALAMGTDTSAITSPQDLSRRSEIKIENNTFSLEEIILLPNITQIAFRNAEIFLAENDSIITRANLIFDRCSFTTTKESPTLLEIKTTGTIHLEEISLNDHVHVTISGQKNITISNTTTAPGASLAILESSGKAETYTQKDGGTMLWFATDAALQEYKASIIKK